ncbi:hypothetical protein CTI12_AA568750 [Artemisia annua]|uniref:RNA-directed DNA polymerase, eukaryota, Reverse transcriptase zinc-binding domain protein n=1 Tax=Artemisia annua TaxID=35608 RepID=A0A2U1KSX6_ARTAN|nr:hypothetical protein CTI12_AA568750 [Artemisia annua]
MENSAVIGRWAFIFNKVSSRYIWARWRYWGGRSVSSNQSPWNAIVSSISNLQRKGIDFLAACNRSLGNRMSICFWDEFWCGNQPLKVLFHNVSALDGDKWCKGAQRINISDWNNTLRRVLRGGAEFSQFEGMVGNGLLIPMVFLLHLLKIY